MNLLCDLCNGLMVQASRLHVTKSVQARRLHHGGKGRNMTIAFRMIMGIATTLVFCLCSSGCSRSTPPDKTADSGVTFDVPKKKDLLRVIEQPASIEPFEFTGLVAHISGYVEKDLAD